MANADHRLAKRKLEVGQQWLCGEIAEGPDPSFLIPYTLVAKIEIAGVPLIVMVNSASGYSVTFDEDGIQYGWKDVPSGMRIFDRSRRKATVKISVSPPATP